MQKNQASQTGLVAIQLSWRAGITPDPNFSVSEWADEHRVLSSKSSAEPGRWRTDRTPYLREIMDCLSVMSPVQRIVFKKGSQIGGTEGINNAIGYIIHMAPGPILAVSPTVEMAKRNSRQRIDPLIAEVPALRERIAPARSRDAGNTVLSKDFQGGVLVMTGANSAVGLRSMPGRYILLDETDGYPGDVDGEGDPIVLAERRSATFAKRRKIFLVSTPTIRGLSRITREYEDSDKREFWVPCPHCQHKQPLKFERLHWPEGQPEKAAYRCEACEGDIYEFQKTDMLARGEWVATAKGDGVTQGYHLSSLYSPVGWFSWEEAARMFEKAQDNPEEMKGFVNTVLGEAYEDEYDAPDYERLYERREIYPIGVVPEGGLFLTSGVDIQRDRIECEVVAWGRNKESWSVDYFLLDGNTAESAVWKKLERVLNTDFPHATGSTLPIRVMSVDSGYATQDVYNWVKKFPQAVFGGAGARASQPRTVVAIKGRDTETALISSVSKADLGGKRQGLRVWSLGVPIAKGELYRWLKLSRPTDEALAKGEPFPAGSCHFPQYGEEYFKQITAEKRVIRLHKGFPKSSWEKDPNRKNEALDCRVYARAAASIYGLDRFKEIHWKRMERALGEKQTEKPRTEKTKTTETLHQLFESSAASQADDPYL